jgi:glutaredoxin 3
MIMFIMYTKSDCIYCIKAKQFLQSRNLNYTEISLDDADVRNEFKANNPTLKTVPQIFVTDGNHHVGGYEDLIDYCAGGIC